MKEKGKKWGVLGISFFALFIGLLLGGAPEQVHAKETFHPTVKPKKSVYKISSDSTYAPFEFSEANGKYVGIDIDLLNRAAELSGFKLKWDHVGFQAAIDQLNAGQADGLMGGMGITPERKKTFDFSSPYYDSTVRLTVKKGNPLKVNGYADLKGKKVGAKTGTVSAKFLEENQKKYNYQIDLYDTADAMYDALNINAIAAFMDDQPVTAYAIKQGREFTLVGKSEPAGKFGFAVLKGQNQELLQMFNDGLAYMKKTGEYQKILNKYKASKEAGKSEQTVWQILAVNKWKFLEGLWTTLVLAFISFVLAMVIGIIFGLLSVSPVKAFRLLSTIYVDIIRGIPLMVVVIFVFFGIPNALHMSAMPKMVAGIIALTLNASAYIAEIVRGGIEAVPVGQMEASRSLGLGYVKTMRKIILPQAIRIMVPSLVNQFVISLKDTTIISAIGLVELVQTSKIIVARNMQSFQVYAIVAVIFLIVITALTKLAKVLERKVKI